MKRLLSALIGAMICAPAFSVCVPANASTPISTVTDDLSDPNVYFSPYCCGAGANYGSLPVGKYTVTLSSSQPISDLVVDGSSEFIVFDFLDQKPSVIDDISHEVLSVVDSVSFRQSSQNTVVGYFEVVDRTAPVYFPDGNVFLTFDELYEPDIAILAGDINSPTPGWLTIKLFAGIPDVGTWLMLLTGFYLAGLRLRRRTAYRAV